MASKRNQNKAGQIRQMTAKLIERNQSGTTNVAQKTIGTRVLPPKDVTAGAGRPGMKQKKTGS